MKQKLTILALTVLLGICSQAQESKLSTTLSYPFPIDNNFIGENYTGIVDIGLQFRFVEANSIRIGASVNTSYLAYFNNPASTVDKVNAYLVQPRVFGELVLPSLQKFRPMVGVGYTVVTLKAKRDGADLNDFKENNNGLNVNLGFSYDVSEKIFIHMQYDFVKLDRDEIVPDETYNTNVNQLKLGVGLRL